jgi:hypothetical protein
VAIVQISRIQQRKGLQTDLPQLAGGELGWSVDTRQLYIGNGTLEEGAPVVGNTQILTEFTNILEISSGYTYQGAAAGYVVQTGPTPGSPITQSLQSRLDSFAIVTEFGAVGDGVTDNTEAINRALFQLYCRQNNTQIRRSLFFPAGVYLVTESILIPPFCTLYGEGPLSSIIKLDVASDISTLNSFVARTADSLQQYGVNIGNNGAAIPQQITIENMGFASLQEVDVFLVDQANHVQFNNVSFSGPLSSAMILNPATVGDIAGVRFNSTANFNAADITFNECQFSNTTYGINTNEVVDSFKVTNSTFDTLLQGIVLTDNPFGCSIVQNTFDNIYSEGIAFYGTCTKNMTGYNAFYDVGNRFGGVSGTPYSPVIYFNSGNNVSLADMFKRSDGSAAIYPRIAINSQASVAIDNGSRLMLGTHSYNAGVSSLIVNNASAVTLFTVSTSVARTFNVSYTVLRGVHLRNGTLTVAADISGGTSVVYSDDFTEQGTTGFTFTVTQAASVVTIAYNTTNTGTAGTIYYNIDYFI